MEKVLIITYYWPPAGGPGVQRWLKFVKYLPEFGIQPFLYTPENPTYPYQDESLLAEVPQDLTVFRTKIKEPYKLAHLFSKKKTQTISSGIIPEQKKQGLLQKMMLYIRGNFFIPDARVLWVKPSVAYLKPLIEKHGIQTVITTGPPHSMHLIGKGLKETCQINWISDFRDPWTKMWYFEDLKLGTSALKKHRKLEKEVLQTADHIITTSPTVQRDFGQKTQQPVHLITNGFDGKPSAQEVGLDQKFTLTHIGSFFKIANLQNLWEVLAELIAENNDFKMNFCLRLIGKNNPDLTSVLEKHGLSAYTENHGYLPHSEVLTFQQQSQVLLLQYTHDEIRGIIPGKLFEYMRAKRPILAIGPKGWDAKSIIEATAAGQCVEFSEKAALKNAIISYFNSFIKGNLSIHSQGIEKYHRKNLTQELSQLIKRD